MPDSAIVVAPEQLASRMEELELFLRDMTWSGEIRPAAHEPGALPINVIGDAIHETVQDGCWIAGDYEQTEYLPDGSPAALWQMHLMCGWSPSEQAYVATLCDNSGLALLMHGVIRDDTFVLQGRSGEMHVRMSWRISGPGIVWTCERLPGASARGRIEMHTCVID